MQDSSKKLTSSFEREGGFSAIWMPLLASLFLLLFGGGAWGLLAEVFFIGESTISSGELIVFVGVKIEASNISAPLAAGDFGVSSSSLNHKP
jgi:hypothetical protein